MGAPSLSFFPPMQSHSSSTLTESRPRVESKSFTIVESFRGKSQKWLDSPDISDEHCDSVCCISPLVNETPTAPPHCYGRVLEGHHCTVLPSVAMCVSAAVTLQSLLVLSTQTASDLSKQLQKDNISVEHYGSFDAISDPAQQLENIKVHCQCDGHVTTVST